MRKLLSIVLILVAMVMWATPSFSEALFAAERSAEQKLPADDASGQDSDCCDHISPTCAIDCHFLDASFHYQVQTAPTVPAIFAPSRLNIPPAKKVLRPPIST